MAINKVPEPQPAAPKIDDTSYNAQNNLIGINEIPERSKLDNWGQTATEPVIKQGTYIYMSGNTYAVETSDEAISGSPSPGINYIELTITGTVITAAWITDVSSYSFNPQQGGFYNGLKMVMPDICYLDGTDYNRGVSINNSLNNYVIADGSVSYAGGLNTRGSDINTGGLSMERVDYTSLTTGSVSGNPLDGQITYLPSNGEYQYYVSGTYDTGSFVTRYVRVYLEQFINGGYVKVDELVKNNTGSLANQSGSFLFPVRRAYLDSNTNLRIRVERYNSDTSLSFSLAYESIALKV